MHREIEDLIQMSDEEVDLVLPLLSKNPIISTGAKIIATVSNHKGDPCQPVTVEAIYDGMVSGLDGDDVKALIKKGFELRDTWED